MKYFSFRVSCVVPFVLLSIIICAQNNARQKNIIYILADDHRYDFMGFTNAVPGCKLPQWIEWRRKEHI
jgi:hypothetical protein